MREKIRNAPKIPDHEVLRKIGGGSYGEVWMARAVTGALRAIKVIWRDDFENDRDFEREFEGIHHYEPISRNHPGLIPILHVGRSKGKEKFYYYVMELADDIERGQVFHPVEYIPRTLRSDIKQADGSPIDVDECLELGVKMSEALAYLHEQGLAHRDVKPANVVFYEGKPKLADIGLVAMPGQRTFVGTEGFVPPEGPGTRRADIYSLGKVLYEMATGMDRLDFPNLPSYDFPLEKAKRWKKLNTVICDVCDPREPHRNIKHAPRLIEALSRIQAGKKLKKKIPLKHKVALALFPLLILLSWATYSILSSSPPPLSFQFKKASAPVKILSSPSGAEVWTTDGEFLGTTPLAGRKAEVGIYQQYEFRLPGYSNTLAGAAVTTTGVVIEAVLPVFAPPESGETWTDVLGHTYHPVKEAHLSQQFISRWAINRFLRSPEGKDTPFAEAKILQNEIPHNVILMQENYAHKYCQWLTSLCVNEGYLTEDFTISPVFTKELNKLHDVPHHAKNQGLHPFQCQVEKIPYGSVALYTNLTEEALYFIDDQEVFPDFIRGAHLISKVRPGKRQLLIEAEGFRKVTQEISLNPHERKAIHLTLQPDHSVSFEKNWTNSLGIPLVPVEKNLMSSVHEITREAYFNFLKETQSPPPPKPLFKQEPDHPIVNITREEAQAFCTWLTKKERQTAHLGDQHHYRLPSDQEWSTLCGLSEEEGDTPSERDISSDESYTWGTEWPPDPEAGNFADQALALEVGFSSNRTITGYNDSIAYTAPVGKFSPTKNGLYDLSGNVYEWVSDAFGLGDYGVTRGGSWKSYQEENLYRSFRNALKPTERNAETGFRIVLSKESSPKVNK